jgi:hypothetical protein
MKKIYCCLLFVSIFLYLTSIGSVLASSENKNSCPIDCSADSKGWNIEFKCEEKGQKIEKSYHKGYTTKFINGKPHISGDVSFKFLTSGNSYKTTVDVRPCPESETGFCIKAILHGAEEVSCQNY